MIKPCNCLLLPMVLFHVKVVMALVHIVLAVLFYRIACHVLIYCKSSELAGSIDVLLSFDGMENREKEAALALPLVNKHILLVLLLCSRYS